MATLSERLALIIDFDGKSAIKGLEGVAKKSEGADKSTRDLSANLTKMGSIGLASAGVAAVGLGKLAMGASDLNEVTSKTNVIFGDAADQVKVFAKDAARSLGQSEAAALGAATQVAQLGKAAGLTGGELANFSTDLVGLAGDLASFNNTSPEDAIVALSAALRGESEPIRQYGVLLDDATLKNRALSMGLIETTTGTLPPAIKVQAAYAEILAQTTDAQGDFARTADGAANQQRILKAELKNLADGIGTGVLPAFTGIVSIGAEVIGKLNEMGPAAQKTLGTLAAGGTGVVAALSGISLISGQLVKMKDRFVEAGDASSYLTTAGKVATGAAIGVGVLAVAIQAMQDRAAAAQGRIVDLRDSMKELGVTAEQAATRKLLELISTTDKFDTAMVGAGLSTEDLTKAISGSASDYRRAQDALEAYRNKLQTTGQQTSAGYKEAVQLSAALREQRTAVAGVAEEERKAAEVKARENEIASKQNETKGEAARLNAVLETTVEDLTLSEEDLKDAMDKQEDAAKRLADAHKDQADATRDAYQAAIESIDPILRLRSGQRDLTAAVKDYKDKLKEATDAKLKDVEKNTAVVEAQDGLIGSLTSVAGAYADTTGAARESQAWAQAYANKLSELRDTNGANLGPAIEIYDQLIARIQETIRQQKLANQTAAGYFPGGGGSGVGPKREGATNGAFTESFGSPTVPVMSSASAAPVNITLKIDAPVVTQQAAQWMADALGVMIRTNGTGWLNNLGVQTR